LTPLPAGLQFFSSGILAGVASTPGTFTVTFAVKDANGISAQKKLDITVDTRPAFRISSTRLLFDGVAGGPLTVPQQVEIGTTPAGRPFTVAADSSWIRTNLSDAVTPGVLSIAADPLGLVPGVFHGIVTVTAEGEAKTINIDFTVAAPPASGLLVDPFQITINTSRGAGIQHQLLSVNRSGSDPVTAQPGVGAPWLKAVVGSPALVDIQVDPSALDNGIYQSFLTIAAGAASVRVPVRVNVGSTLFEVSRSTVALEVAMNDPGMAATASQQILVLNRDGEPRAWYADATAPWIRLDPAVGIARPRSPLDITASAIGLVPGIYQSAVIVTPRFNGNSLPIDVLFQVRSTPPAPQISPAGLAFRTTDGSTAAPQNITLRNGTAAPMGFVTALEPGSSSTWLTLISPSGTIPAGGTFAFPVSVKPQGLAAGQYEAAINIEFADQTVRVARILLTVASATCKPATLRPVWTRPGDHFQGQAGWPIAVEVMTVDNCGNPVDQGAVLVHFSDRSEPALPLISAGNGNWTGTWTPTLPHTSITGIADAQSLTGLKGQSAATGVVSAASSGKTSKF
jgi:hypothetical protein